VLFFFIVIVDDGMMTINTTVFKEIASLHRDEVVETFIFVTRGPI
jgi:hypothetical protein